MTASNLLTDGASSIAGIPIDAEALRRVPKALALRYDVLSLRSEWDELVVAVPPGADEELIERVRLATGMRVRAVAAPAAEIRRRLAHVYGVEEDAPAIRALDDLCRAALAAGASDVHFEPSPSGGTVRLRVDGRLRAAGTLPGALFPSVVSRVKLLAGMDIADRRAAQDGGFRFQSDGRDVDARVSAVPTIAGERLVIRLLDAGASLPRLGELGMPPDMLERFRSAVSSASGFIVVCGPTGSGKTTTAYAALAERDGSAESICTVEDPVEMRVPQAAQVQVNLRAGVTFGSAIRAFLRHDPNVIFVGEVRDAETASAACAAALTGQFVVTTLHSRDAVSAVERLRELAVAPRTIAASLTAVIAQRLVRKRCGCAGRPCSMCAGAGLAGRAALFELLLPSDGFRIAVAAGASPDELRALAYRDGFRPMAEHGEALLREAATTRAELDRLLYGERAS